MVTSGDGGDGKSGKDASEQEIDYRCGFRGWRPEWLQPFANAKTFVLMVAIVGVLQGAYFTYIIGVLSTLEKRFAFESKLTGFILIADNISQIVISPIIGYLGSKYNRAVLVGVGEV